MKKSKYLTRNDYINYYTKQQSLWFFTNAEILAAINAEIQILSKQETDVDNEELDGEENTQIIFDDSEFNVSNWELFKKNISSEDKFLNSFIDNFLEVLEEIKKTNPMLHEAKIINERIKDYYKILYPDYYVVDLSLERNNNPEHLAKLTQKWLKEQELMKIIILNAVFIDENKQLLATVDCLVKNAYNEEIKIYKLQLTSSSKIIHFFDLLYLKQIIENSEYFNEKNDDGFHMYAWTFEYFTTLIKYEKLMKNQISFISTPKINLSKTTASTNKSLTEKQEIKLGYKFDKKGNDNSIDVNELLNANQWDGDGIDKRIKEKINELIEIKNNFNDVIQQLHILKEKLTDKSLPIQNLFPHRNDNSKFKTSEWWMKLKKLYQLKGYQNFKYSGFLTWQDADTIHEMQPKQVVFRKSEYAALFNNSKEIYFLNKSNVMNELAKIANKKVYFDFECINNAIRVVDNSLPNTQIITQCSILKINDALKDNNEQCINLMIDPREIDLNWFKKIVDELYEGIDCSYIVYNANFEKKRLEEIKEFINESIYDEKIAVIISRLFDLANFFDVRKDMFFIKELGGFYSIKKVLPLIKKYDSSIFQKTKCVDYNELEIQNGLLCQQKTACRFLNLINDYEWNIVVEESKKYCENDVRAMVAVYYFIIDFLIPHCE